MVLIRTESTLYTTNGSFGEIINKFQDCNIKKNKKGDLGIAKNYQGITLTSIVANPKLRKYLGRTKMTFREIDP